MFTVLLYIGEGVACADPEFFMRGGPNLNFFFFFFFFLVDEGRGSKEKNTKSWPSSMMAHH